MKSIHHGPTQLGYNDQYFLGRCVFGCSKAADERLGRGSHVPASDVNDFVFAQRNQYTARRWTESKGA